MGKYSLSHVPAVAGSLSRQRSARKSTILSTLLAVKKYNSSIATKKGARRGTPALVRSTKTATKALNAKKSVAVGESSARMRAAAISSPGSYAAGALNNQKFNRSVLAKGGGTPRQVDHFPTDYSQRGPKVGRGSKENQLDTINRPALVVPKYLHDEHPTTKQGHGRGTLAYKERKAQLSEPNEKGRYKAVELHMKAYYSMKQWPSMSENHFNAARASFESALDTPTFLRDDNGILLKDVPLSRSSKDELLKRFNASRP